jgi:HAMP domain-containing protein
MASEFARISAAVGKEGKITQRVSLGTVSGGWSDCIDSVNELIGDLVQPSTEVARVIGAVAKGDLTQTMALEVDGRSLKGEFLHTARVVNTMVEQLNSFASEVTRVAREVGTEGRLGGQADVKGVAGTWKDLTESVNSMASNLTNQVRNIAGVTTAVAKGDLTTKITVDARGDRAQEHDQHDGGSAQLVCIGSDARGARGGYGRKARRSGGSEGCWRCVERSHRFGQLDGLEPDEPGA